MVITITEMLPLISFNKVSHNENYHILLVYESPSQNSRILSFKAEKITKIIFPRTKVAVYFSTCNCLRNSFSCESPSNTFEIAFRFDESCIPVKQQNKLLKRPSSCLLTPWLSRPLVHSSLRGERGRYSVCSIVLVDWMFIFFVLCDELRYMHFGRGKYGEVQKEQEL